MPGRSMPRAAWLQCLVIGAVVISCSQPTAALSWRIYAGWQDCVSAFLPDNQWELVKQSLKATAANGTNLDTVPTAVIIEAGVLVADEYGSETHKGSLDVSVTDPTGKEIHNAFGIYDDEMEVEAQGVRGPWRMCFKVHSQGVYRPPSMLVEISYFTVNHRSLVGTSYEWEKSTQHPLPPDAHLDHPQAALAHHADKEHMATAEQVEAVMEGLTMLDAHLQGVEHEQHHLQMRSTRHLKTIKSTHRRTLFYYFGIYLTIVAAALLQVAGVRYMFAGDKGGRLPVSLGRMGGGSRLAI